MTKTPDTLRLDQLLADRKGGLGGLLARAERLSRLQSELRAILAEPWAQTLRVADLRGAVLVVHADHAAALTRLRQLQPMLLSALRRSVDPGLAAIEVRVRPPPAPV